jgi:hypothetical protein
MGKTRGLNEVAGELPAERMGLISIPVADETNDRGFERLRVVEAAVAQDPALQDGEPDFDLVEPRGMQRRVNEAEAAAVPSVELAPPAVPPVVVDVEVVPDDDHAPLGGAACKNFHEPQERGCIAMKDHLAEHLARAHVERAEQGARAMTNVLEFIAQAAVRRDVRRVHPREHLHGLLIDAKHVDVFRRVEVEPADAPDLGPEVGVWAV